MAGVPPPGSLSRYVPAVAAEWGLTGGHDTWRVVQGSLCLLDISGFTALSERLAAFGRIGAEELTDVLSGVFASMVDLAHRRGGQQLKFGGDALLLLFTGERHAVQAACAAVEMRAELRAASRATRTSVGRVDLRVSMGVTSGDVHLFRVGASHRELVVAGPLATEVTRLEKAAAAGRIVVGDTTRDALGSRVPVRRAAPGWSLGWRRSPVPGRAGPPRPDVPDDVLAGSVPVALRELLAAGRPLPEHRSATVGFLGFDGVDELVRDVAAGPARAAAAIDEVVSTVQEAADREGVTFLASDVDAGGGKLILVAGAPRARGDDEGRMLRALRAVVDTRLPLPVRIGVHGGHVFAGEVGGTDRASSYTVMGDTVNLAARLMAAAPPGAIYTTAGVLEGSHTRYDSTALDPLRMKGKSAEVHAYAVGDEIGMRPPTSVSGLPFVGRHRSLVRLVGMMRSLGGGSGGAVVVEGAAGVGKTRLVDEAIALVDGVAVVRLGAEPYRSATPFRPLRDALRDLLGVERAGMAAMARRLRRHLGSVAPDLLPWLPLVGDVTHIDVPPTPEVSALEPRFRPERTAEVVERLVAATKAGPVVFVADDAHVMDEATCRVLDRLATAAERPWLVVAVRRPQQGGFAPAGAPGMVLEPLGEAAARDLVLAATASAPMRPDEVRRVVARGDGNPLYLTEIVRAARELGGVERLPRSVDAVVEAQIDALPPLARFVLRCAAVLGESFRPVVLDELLAGERFEVDDATTQVLDSFLERYEERVRFRHTLVREVAYEGLPYRRRRELHRRAGQVIERTAGDATDALAYLLALHYARAHEHRRAWHFGVVAGDRARAAFANVEAAANYELALGAAPALDDVGARARADVLVHLGDVRQRAGDFPGAFDAYRHAGRLLLDDPLGRARVALRRARARERMGSYPLALRDLTSAVAMLDSLDTTPAGRRRADRLRAQMVSFSAVVRQAQGRPRQARLLAARAVEASRSAGDRAALARAYVVLDWAERALGAPVREPLGEIALALYREIDDLPGQAMVTANLGALRYLEGRWDDAARLYDEASATLLRMGDAVQAANAAANTGELLVSQGRLDEAEPVLRSAARVLRASSFSDGATFAEQQLGRLLARRGATAEAVELLRSVHGELVAAGQHAATLEVAIHLADALVDAGEPADALDLVRSAEARAGDEAIWMAAPGALVRGRSLAALGDLGAAAGELVTGIAHARDQELPYELVMLLREVIALDVRRGAPPDEAMLREIGDIGRSLGLRDVEAWAVPPAGPRAGRDAAVSGGSGGRPPRTASR